MSMAKGALCGFDDLVGDGVGFIDLQDAADLGDESFEESKVSLGEAGDGGGGVLGNVHTMRMYSKPGTGAR